MLSAVGVVLYSHDQLYKHKYMHAEHKDNTIKTSEYTYHFIWKGCVWEGVGDRTELQHIDPHSIGHNRISFPFSLAAKLGAWGPTLLDAGFLYHILSSTRLIPQLIWSPTATAQSGAWGPPLLGAGFLYRILFPTDLISKLIEFPVHWVI